MLIPGIPAYWEPGRAPFYTPGWGRGDAHTHLHACERGDFFFGGEEFRRTHDGAAALLITKEKNMTRLPFADSGTKGER